MNDSFFDLITFFWPAVAAAALSGAFLGETGIFLHQRRALFLGAALPQTAGFGLVVMTLVTSNEYISLFAAVCMCTAFLCIKPAGDKKGVTLETVIGIGFVVSMAATLLLLSKTNTDAHIQELMFKGSLLTAGISDISNLLLLCLPMTVVLLILKKRFLMTNLLPMQAQISGINVRFYEILQFFILSTVTVASLKISGIMATFGFLIFPCLCALSLSQNVGRLFWLSPLVGILSAVLGVMLAIRFDLPSGPAMIIVLFFFWLLSYSISHFLKRSI